MLAGSQSALRVLDDHPVECDLAIVVNGDRRNTGQGGAQHVGAAYDPQGPQHAAEAFNVGQHDVLVLRLHVGVQLDDVAVAQAGVAHRVAVDPDSPG